MTDKRDSARRTQFSDLVEIMARLRGPDGCPWDREQDHRSLRRCLLEEAYEVLETIDRGDPAALRDELGDLLLQVIFHAQLAAEAGEFDVWDVVHALYDKLVSRHPHVFGDKQIETAKGVVDEWERGKREARGRTAAEQMAAAPLALPALARAQVLLRQAGRAGRSGSVHEARSALEAALEAAAEAAPNSRLAEEALGQVLFAAVDLACLQDLDAEAALREHLQRFVAEFSGGQG